MKKFYLILAAIAAMTFNAQADHTVSRTLYVGDYENADVIYNGSYFDMAPTNFYLAHTGAQLIYTADELADMQGKKDAMVTGISFKFTNGGAFEEITRTVKLYLQEIDETAFAVVEGVKQFFTFDNLVTEYEVTYDMYDFMYEDNEVVFDLTDMPFAVTTGKSLLMTIVFDALDDDNCTIGSDYAPFYTTGIRGKGMVYTNNWTGFEAYAEGPDFPDATAMLGCGTNVELPVTKIDFCYSEHSTSLNEVNAATADGAYYNLMGQKMNANNLPAGIYIHNGQKIIIR
jgi:hypothetical protein